MAEFDNDAEDRLLRSLLAEEPLADAGFSERVLSRLRRRLWIRRLCLPVAAAIGASIAFEPLAELAAMLRRVAQQNLPALLAAAPDLPPLPIVAAAAALVLIGATALTVFED